MAGATERFPIGLPKAREEKPAGRISGVREIVESHPARNRLDHLGRWLVVSDVDLGLVERVLLNAAVAVNCVEAVFPFVAVRKLAEIEIRLTVAVVVADDQWRGRLGR